MVAPFGTAVVAAYGVGNQVTAFGISILVGIGLGLSSLIGHNLGSEKPERAKKIADRAIMLGVGIMFVFGAVVFMFSAKIIGLFFSNPETIAYGSIMLKIFAFGFPFIGVLLPLEQVHMGVGLNTPTMVVNIIHSWLLEVIPIYLLTVYFGFTQTAIWWTISGAGLVTSAMFFIYYQRGRWLTYKV
jgi:Na+-driven multidrug efflux pump